MPLNQFAVLVMFPLMLLLKTNFKYRKLESNPTVMCSCHSPQELQINLYRLSQFNYLKSYLHPRLKKF